MTRRLPLEALTGLLLCGLLIAGGGCGYTMLHPPPSAEPAASATETSEIEEQVPAGEVPDGESAPGTIEELVLPPGHPLILEPEDWVGRSFLDDIVGEADPLRFENVRANLHGPTAFEHATLRMRITVGGPASLEIWQIQMDEFGWVKAAHWTQGAAGPELDEMLASDRVEFRIARESEAALRVMMIQLLPGVPHRGQMVRPRRLDRVPRELWPHDEPGLLELEYHVETSEAVSPEDWPGGQLSAPLDLVQILIGTWDSAPPVELQRDIWMLAESRPLLLNLAIFTEAIVLAWEIEGSDQARVDLPLWVGR